MSAGRCDSWPASRPPSDAPPRRLRAGPWRDACASAGAPPSPCRCTFASRERPIARPTPLPPRGPCARARRARRLRRPSSQVALVHLPHPLQMPLERHPQALGQHGHPVLAALPAPHHDLPPPEIQVLHPKPQRLRQPQAGAIEQRRDQPDAAAKLGEDRADLLRREHHRQPDRPPGPDQPAQIAERIPEDVPVQEQQGAQRLHLSAVRHSAVHHQPIEKLQYLCLPHGLGMPGAVVADVAENPGQIGLLGTQG